MTMPLRDVPGIDKPASAIGLGTVLFGSRIAPGEAFRMLDLFAASGGNVVDTAHVYAAWEPDGEGASERCVGDWLRSSGLRSDMIVSTKGGHPAFANIDKPRLTPATLRRDLQESLDRLRLDRVDVYWFHRDNAAVPAGELMDAMFAFQDEGLVGSIGASNWTVERLLEANAHARDRGREGVIASQISWSMAPMRPERFGDMGGLRGMDRTTYEFHARTGLPVFAYSSQAAGFFSGLHDWTKPLHGDARAQDLAAWFLTAEHLERWKRVHAMASAKGCSMNQLALAWLLGDTAFPAVALIGPRNADQLHDSLGALEVRLTEDERRHLVPRMP